MSTDKSTRSGSGADGARDSAKPSDGGKSSGTGNVSGTGNASGPANSTGPASTSGPASAAPAGSAARTGDATQAGGANTAGRSSRWSWLLPVLTFLAGCALGALVVGVGTTSDDGSNALASPSPSKEPDAQARPTPTPTDLVVRVPGACLEAAEGATQAAGQIDDAVAAVRDLDARRLQEIVDGIQRVQPEVQRLADECRSLAGARLGDGLTGAPTPAPAATS